MKTLISNNNQVMFDLDETTFDEKKEWVENAQRDAELAKSNNQEFESFTAYSQINGFQTDLFKQDIISTATVAQVQKWMANPDTYRDQLEAFIAFQYISNPSVFQLFDTAFSLPSLNYKFNRNFPKNTDESIVDDVTDRCKSALTYSKHKILTRQLMTQLATAGTVCACWVGTKRKPVLYVFDDLEYIFPAYQNGSDWVIWLDLSWFRGMTDRQREITINSLKPVVSMDDWEQYQKNPSEYRYLELPLNRSVYLSTHRLYKNQRFGLPWGTQTGLDLLHKERLKMLEKSIANKVINSVALLSLGESDKDSALYHDQKIRKDKRKVVNGVKAGLKANEEGKTPIIAVPHWADLKFVEVNTDGLDSKKFETTNKDINIANGGMDSLYNGSATLTSGKLTLGLLYDKVAVMLEQIEIEVYQKLFNYVLPVRNKDYLSISYDKEMPMTKKEKVSFLKDISSTHGFSIKAVIDNIDGVDWDEYLEQTIYEQEVLDLPNRIQPFGNAFTSDGSSDSGGEEIVEDPTPEGERSRTTE